MHQEDTSSDLSDDEFIRSYTERMMRSLELREYTDEEELIRLTTYETMVIHFHDPSFERCRYMNDALLRASSRFPHIRFGTINVNNCPKMCASLKIRVLPFLGFFRDGYFVDKLVGFEGLALNNMGTFHVDELVQFVRSSEIAKGAADS